mgnify:CR=1 FL=1
MPGSEIELNLSIPDQTLSSLSFSNHTSSEIKKWVKDLPLANVGEISRQLYQAIIELNQLVLNPGVRMQLLELLRPPIDYVCKELSKHFLNQSVVLTEKQQKVANLAQAIQIHLASGYKIVMVETVPGMTNEKNRKGFACAAHRMISEYGQVLLRANQLYTAIPKNIWLEMHQVYKVAEAEDLLKYTVTDEHNKQLSESRIDEVYKCNILLSCCRPNQLRQHDIQLAFEAFQLWANHCNIGADIADDSVFIMNMEQDLPCRYKSLMNGPLTSQYYGFDTRELVELISKHIELAEKKSTSGSELQLPRQVTDILLNHFNQAFGILTKRTFKRIENEGSLSLCIGLSASHYYTSGKVEFHTQMFHSGASNSDTENNIFLTQARRQHDAWSEAADVGGHQATTPADSPISFNRAPEVTGGESYPSYVVPLVNTSPGGYCLQWQGEVPSNIQAGEILSLRESEKQPWSVAVIRWIRHIKKKGTQIGIELLAPGAKPCGVQLLHKTGDPSEYLRGMLLPELSGIGQPATLITPRLPFQSGHKVSIKFSDAETKCQLEMRVSATSSFNQFELSKSTHIRHEQDNITDGSPNSQTSEDDFDSLWPTL